MEHFKRPFDPNNVEDKEKILDLKKKLFDELKIEQNLLSDAYLSL